MLFDLFRYFLQETRLLQLFCLFPFSFFIPYAIITSEAFRQFQSKVIVEQRCHRQDGPKSCVKISS